MDLRDIAARLVLILPIALAITSAHAAQHGSKGPEMIPLQGGWFQMGSYDQGPDGDERQHEVRVDAMAIGKFEVTFEEYDQFAHATGRRLPDDEGWGRGRRPVINVSWDDAMAYADWLSVQTGERYRLPTEAEWEYAARAGTNTAYWWGERAGAGNANCEGCGGLSGRNRGTAPVGSFRANPFGLYDTAGNVWEWTCNLYSEEYDGSESRCASKNRSGGWRVFRGGSWFLPPRFLRSALRNSDNTDFRFGNLGFRLAQDTEGSADLRFVSE